MEKSERGMGEQEIVNVPSKVTEIAFLTLLYRGTEISFYQDLMMELHEFLNFEVSRH